MEISYMIELALTAGIGVITFFLKRTIDELDSCKKNIAKIKEDYITKEDFFREQNENHRKLDRRNGVQISVSSVQRYASNLNETLQSLRLAQENFRAVMEETEKYKNLDVTDGILRLLSNQVFQAINNLSEEQAKEIDFETLMKNAVALTRAVAYKKKIDIGSQSVLENGADQFQSLIFEVMADEDPALYKKVKKFVKSKQEKE